MRELLSNNSLFVGQVRLSVRLEDKSLALRARDLIFFTTDLQTVNQQFTAGADLFLKLGEILHLWSLSGKHVRAINTPFNPILI